MNEGIISSIIYNMALEKGFKMFEFDEISGSEINVVPTQTMLKKWLREKHGIHVEIVHYHKNNVFGKSTVTNYYVDVNGDNYDNDWTDYELALEFGLQKALKLL